ncbi:hypothetical protein NQZ68_018382 [Dissostichus eleginoides]|nr:hypothetical protein NQZ68_018382 [Dissostichus eleginoides]
MTQFGGRGGRGAEQQCRKRGGSSKDGGVTPLKLIFNTGTGCIYDVTVSFYLVFLKWPLSWNTPCLYRLFSLGVFCPLSWPQQSFPSRSDSRRTGRSDSRYARAYTQLALLG